MTIAALAALTLVSTPIQATASTGWRASASNCKQLFSQKKHEKRARAVYKRNRITKRAKARLVLMRKCMYSQQARINARRLVRKLRKRWKQRQFILAITPYDCGKHGRFAIPCGIIACESHFSWGAYNPSGAVGPYQLLGKGVSLSDPPYVHHKVAAALWAGGRGASHWVCKA